MGKCRRVSECHGKCQKKISKAIWVSYYDRQGILATYCKSLKCPTRYATGSDLSGVHLILYILSSTSQKVPLSRDHRGKQPLHNKKETNIPQASQQSLEVLDLPAPAVCQLTPLAKSVLPHRVGCLPHMNCKVNHIRGAPHISPVLFHMHH